MFKDLLALEDLEEILGTRVKEDIQDSKETKVRGVWLVKEVQLEIEDHLAILDLMEFQEFPEMMEDPV